MRRRLLRWLGLLWCLGVLGFVGALVPVVGGGVALAAEPGPWVWPLAGSRVVSRSFDPPSTRYGPGHRGADLAGSSGQTVLAAGAGRIAYAGMLAGRGVVVVVHGDLRTTYEPVTASVRAGEQVTAGGVIGRLDAGHLGCARTCLHWGLLRGQVYLDPVQLVRRGPSRLLPLDGSAALPHSPSRLHASGGSVAPPSFARVPPTRPSSPAAAAPALARAARPATEPAFALRATDAAWAGVALLALIAGLALVRRPGPSGGPAAPAASSAQPPRVASIGRAKRASVPDADGAVDERPVDLASERRRRRPEVA